MRPIQKRDMTHVRTASALERKYRFEKSFVGTDDKDQVVDMVNTAGKPISAALDQSSGDNGVSIKDGTICLKAPPETMEGGDANVSGVLLITFIVGKRTFGVYAYGEYFPDEDGVHWEPSQLRIKEITKQGESNA